MTPERARELADGLLQRSQEITGAGQDIEDGQLVEAATALRALADEVERLREELRWLVDQHHRTLTGSKMHDPENREWTSCACGPCSRVPCGSCPRVRAAVGENTDG